MPDQLDPTALEKFLRSMRSVRRFAPTPLTDDVVTSILEVGRWTGSSKNTQPWELVVIRERSTLVQLSRLGRFAEHLNGAALAIALVMDSPASSFDAGRLAERLMLGAWAHGVGSCIGSLFPDDNEAKAKTLLGVPAERSMHTSISFGYPADAVATRVKTTPDRVSVLPSIARKPLGELVHFGRFGAK